MESFILMFSKGRKAGTVLKACLVKNIIYYSITVSAEGLRFCICLVKKDGKDNYEKSLQSRNN